MGKVNGDGNKLKFPNIDIGRAEFGWLGSSSSYSSSVFFFSLLFTFILYFYFYCIFYIWSFGKACIQIICK